MPRGCLGKRSPGNANLRLPGRSIQSVTEKQGDQCDWRGVTAVERVGDGGSMDFVVPMTTVTFTLRDMRSHCFE